MKSNCQKFHQMRDLISTRWVLTVKNNLDGTTRHKDRLVARGFENDAKEKRSRDSPVASKAAQRLVIAACADEQWFPHCWDFSTAFLQWKSLIRREDVILAPPEGRARPGFHGV